MLNLIYAKNSYNIVDTNTHLAEINRFESMKQQVLDCKTISDFQSVLNYYKNLSQDEKFVYLGYAVHPGTKDTKYWVKDSLEMECATQILEVLEKHQKPIGDIPKENIESFLLANKEFFLETCAFNFIGSKLCPESIMLDFQKGAFANIEAKEWVTVTQEDYRDQHTSEKTKLLGHQEFLSQYGKMMGKIINNINTLNPSMPSSERIEVITALATTLGVDNKQLSNSDNISFNYRFNTNLYNMSDNATKFLFENFDDITKGTVPKSFLRLISLEGAKMEFCKKELEKVYKGIKTKEATYSVADNVLNNNAKLEVPVSSIDEIEVAK